MSFFGINLSARAMQAFQTALDVTGHNVANINTRGYSRQRVSFSPSTPFTSFGAWERYQLGTGVKLDGVMRIRDQYVDQRFRTADSDAARYGALNEQLKQIETMFNEPGTATLGNRLDAFFNAFQQLSTNPNSDSLRQAARDAGDMLARRFRGLFDQMNQFDADLDTQITAAITRADDLSGKIAKLNESIQIQVATGAQPNDLMDQRDILVGELAKIIDIDVRAGQNGAINIFAGEARLVWNEQSFKLPPNLDVTNMTLSANPIDTPLRGGELTGLVEAKSKLGAYRTQLNDLASSIISRVNALHSAGTGKNGSTGLNFFAGTNAGSIDLSTEIKTDTDNLAAGMTVAAGDGAQALAIARLREETQAALGGITMGTFYNQLVTTIGQDTNLAKANLDAQDAVLAQMEQMQQATAGVNLDEEMTNMMRYQRSYQAAARMVTMFDDMLRETIEQLGR